jgi:hypothetical protein
LGQRISGLIRQVTSWKRFNSYEIFYEKTRKRWPFNTGDCLIEVTSWAGLTVYYKKQCNVTSFWYSVQYCFVQHFNLKILFKEMEKYWLELLQYYQIIVNKIIKFHALSIMLWYATRILDVCFLIKRQIRFVLGVTVLCNV